MRSRAIVVTYAELLSRKQPRVIRTDRENDAALRDVEDLMRRGDRLTAAERDLLALLVILIERYEEQRYAPARVAEPREVLAELMSARGMTQADLSRFVGSRGLASEILSGKRAISKSQAKRLSQHFHVSASLFL